MKQRPMTRGIALRLVVSHLIMVVLALVVFVLVVSRVTDRQAEAAGMRADQAMAVRLAPWIERYYHERGSWKGLTRLLEERMLPADGTMMSPRSRMAPRPPNVRSPHMADSQLRALIEQPILLLSHSGEVLVSRGVNARIVDQHRRGLEAGYPIGGQDSPIAYLFLGAMANPESNPFRVALVRTMRAAAVTTAAVVLLAVAFATLLWMRWLVRPLRALSGAASAMAAGAYDTRVGVPPRSDELADLAGSFNRMAEEIEAQEQARRRFVADAAHELRTPLSLIAARVEMLATGVYAADQSQWDGLKGGIDRMQQLVTDLQMLARMESGRLELRVESIDVHALLAQMASAFEPAAAERGIALTTVHLSQDRRPRIMADRRRTQQVLSNLLSNAVRYTNRGGAVRIGCTSGEPGFVTIWVDDDGPGIPSSERHRVFERFVRLDESRDRAAGGSGLGLAIAQELTRLQGGVIDAGDSTSGHGARFSIRLPSAD